MKLYHCRESRSLRPLWTMEEMGLPYELVVMPFPPRFLHEGYLGLNPLGTVPFFVDGNTQMTESAGISQYLVDRYGPTSLAVAKDEEDYGHYLNWLHRSDATLTFPQTLVLRYTRLEPEERRNPQVVEDYRRWFLSRLKSVERALEGQEYLCADRFTIADICVGFAIFLSQELGIAEALTPNVKRYWGNISARPAFRRALER
jgi:glutathione S-transferase